MKKIKDIVNSSWFKAAAIGGIGVLLLLDKNVLLVVSIIKKNV